MHEVGYTSLSHFVYDGTWRVNSFNAVEHLSAGLPRCEWCHASTQQISQQLCRWLGYLIGLFLGFHVFEVWDVASGG